MEAPGFWDDPEISNRKMKELKNLKDVVDTINGLSSQYEDIELLIQMGYEEEDAQLAADIRKELDEFIASFEEIRISTLLSGEYDGYNAILKLNAGAGGTESCDWCSMLYRMYTRWAERKGFFRGGAGLSGWRRGRNQISDLPGQWNQCLRLSEIREGCTQACEDFPF